MLELEKTGSVDSTGFGISTATAKIMRVPIRAGTLGHEFEIDDSKPMLTLIDMLHAEPGSILITSGLQNFVTRLDDISNVLVWSAAEGSDGFSIDFVEFPRLNMSFRVKDHNGLLVLKSDDHPRLHVTSDCPRRVLKLLAGMPTAILLVDDDGQYSVMTSAATQPVKLQGDVLRIRNDESWQDALGDVRHYMYPVHLSGSFLMISSLASTMYAMLWRLLSGSYELAFKIADACVSDTQLSPEEKHIWNRIGQVSVDPHPDACACRLKISIETTGCENAMPCPWTITDEVAMYCAVRTNVSAACRLTDAEEVDLLSRCEGFTLAMLNRKNILDARQHLGPDDVVYAEIAYPPKPSGSLPFDRLCDRTFIEPSIQSIKGFAKGGLASMSNIAYARPLKAETHKSPEEQAIGAAAADILHNILKDGLSLFGTDRLGFLFFYELFTSTLHLKIDATESTHTLASILLRVLPSSDTEAGMEMSILRALECNPKLASSAPKFEEEKGMLKKSKGRSKFVHAVAEYLRLHQDRIKFREVDEYPEDFWLLAGAPGHPSEQFSPPTCTLGKLAELRRKDRSNVCPRVLDYGCYRRNLKPMRITVASRQPLGMTQTELETCAAKVMSPIGLDGYVKLMTRKERGLDSVNPKLQFDTTQHKQATSYVARQMLERLNKD
ncbi:hypothetical protein N8602_00255, partial [bacterium]|nr:hypothetical protein [bacterium]